MADIDRELAVVALRHKMLPMRGGSADIAFLLDRLAASEARVRELEAAAQRLRDWAESLTRQHKGTIDEEVGSTVLRLLRGSDV